MLTLHDLKNLAAVPGPCLTIYQPLRDDHSPFAKPETRMEAALQKAGRLLEARGINAAGREEMLQPLEKTLTTTDWTGQDGSLVLFRAPNFTMTSFWPDALAPRVHFAQEFLVLPLLPAILNVHDFWLLALSMKAVRLFRGSRAGLTEVPLPKGVAKSLSEDEAFDQPDHTLRARSSAGRFVGAMKGVQFGTSPAREREADYIHDFFTSIARGIRPILANDKRPLILAGVARELAIYREVNADPLLLPGGIHGNPDALGTGMLHQKAAELMSGHAAQMADAVNRRMDEAAGSGLLITDAAAGNEAAREGRIDELIVAFSAPAFKQQEEVINQAALAAIRNSGKISVLNASQPASGVAAILRFGPTRTRHAAKP